MSEAINNTAPHREDNEIIIQLCIINELMDRMTNEFGDKLDKLERQYANNHDGVQNMPE
jgi:hypothetical protein